MQGTVLIEPDKGETMLQVKGQARCVEGMYAVVYFCRWQQLSQDSAGEGRRTAIRGRDMNKKTAHSKRKVPVWIGNSMWIKRRVRKLE